MTKTTIRRAHASDATVLAELGARSFAETFGHLYPPEDLYDFLRSTHAVEKIAGELANPALAHWLAEEADGQAVGYAQAGPCALPHPDVSPRCGELRRIYVLAAWQGGETGRSLMDAALDWLVEERRHPLWIGVWSGNARALAFYRRRGFEEVGAYQFRVGATLDDELILRRGDPGDLRLRSRGR